MSTEKARNGAKAGVSWNPIPGGNFPDQNAQALSTEDISQLTNYLYTQSGIKPVDNNPNIGYSVTSEQTSRVDNEVVAKIVTRVFNYIWTGQSGWWTEFASIEKRGLNELHEMQIWDPYALEPAAEDAPVRHITHRTEQWRTKMERYNLGAEFRVEELQRDTGMDTFFNSVMTLVAAGWTNAKLSVANAMYGAKQYWREFGMSNGKAAFSLEEASRQERDLFGIFNKTDRGLYRANNMASRLAESQNKRFTKVVFPAGTLDLISSNTFETDAYRRGEAQAMATLALGGRALENAISGLTIFEDKVWTVTNLPRDQIEQFVRRVWVGQFFTILGSEVKCSESEEYDPECLLSIQVPSAEGNRWEKITAKDCIKWDMRWNEDDGELSEHHDQVLELLPNLLQTLGYTVEENLLDPFFWKTDVPLDDINRTTVGAGFQKVELFGEVDPRHCAIESNIKQGQITKANLVRSGILSSQNISNIQELKRLSNLLSSPADVSDESLQGFFFAISANPENAGVSAADRSKPDLFLEGHAHGAPLPPYIEELPGGRKVMYVLAPNDAGALIKQYVYVTRNVAKAGSPVNANTPAIYFLSPAGVAGAAASVPVGYAAAATEDAAQGYDAAVLVTAPPRAYGYGGINGLRTLAALHGAVNNRGWNSDFLEKVHRGIQSLDGLIAALHEIHPLNPMFEGKFIPAFQRCPDERLNNMNVCIQSLWDKIHYPIMVRSANGRLSTPVDFVARDDVPKVAFGRSEAVGIGRHMGLGFRRDTGEVEYEGLPRSATYLQGANRATFEGELLKLLNSPLLDSGIKQKLKSDHGKSLFTAYASSLGASYAKNSKGATTTSPDFIVFFQNEVLPELLNGKMSEAAKAFNGVLNMATSKNTIKELTPQFVDTIKKAAVQSQGKGSKKRTDAVVALGAAATPGWVNSRLVLDQAVWNKVSRDVNADSDHYVKYYRMVIRPSLRSDQTVALAGELLGDAASVFNPRSYDTPRGNLKKQIQFAGPHQGRGVGFFEHLNLMDAGSNNKRRAYAGPGELYGPISSAANAFASQLSVSEYSEEDGTPQRIPGTMINTPVDSPFYTSVRQTDMRGTHVHDATTVVQKKWLVWRMAEIEKECGSDDIVRMAAQLGLFSRVNKNTLLTWINKKIPLLFDCWVVGMPFMRFSMGDGCWFLPGPNTARIGYNYENLILQLDGVHMKWYLQLSMYLGTTVYDSSNFLILTSLVFKGYHGGWNLVPFLRPNEFGVDMVADSNSSIFVMNCGGNLTLKDIPQPITLTGRYNENAFQYNLANRRAIFQNNKPHLPCSLYYASVWGFTDFNRNTTFNTKTYASERNSTYRNDIMFSGTQRNYNPATKSYGEPIMGQSHVAPILPPYMGVVHGDNIALDGPGIKQ
jgi:hypothetical protein